MSDDTGTAHARQHANGRWARVILDVINGQWLYAAGTLDAEPNGVRPTLAEAKSAPDAFAHPGCDGEGCSPWLGDGRAEG